MLGKTYYNILEIRMDASSQEIKEAHRKMLLKCHPDKLPSEQLKRYNEISKKRDNGESLSVEDERL